MEVKEKKEITISKNRRASFDFFLTDKFVAGIKLSGTEIKSIRQNTVNISDSYCLVHEGEVYIRNMSVELYKEGTYNNHEVRADRKLLLNKREIKKIINNLKDKGVTLIPLRLFISEGGFAKLDISLAKGKKNYDKRDTIKDRDNKRELDRRFK
ncbi:MAG: SsrA-binding protein SmpB [Bacteroidota bacterium]|jgi:SsrA-binding protein